MNEPGWLEANQRHLTSALATVRATLEDHAARLRGEKVTDERRKAADEALRDASEAMPAPPALDVLCSLFGLSPFERDILLMCAGMELRSDFRLLCSSAHGDPLLSYPTFGLALAALSDPHWSAIVPGGPLRRWHLVEIGTGSSLISSPLRVDERVLHYLAGVQQIDERLADMVKPAVAPEEIAPSHDAIAGRVAAVLSDSTSPPPVVQLCGNDLDARRDVAATACILSGLELGIISSDMLPQGADELLLFMRLWQREAILTRGALLLECDDWDADRPQQRAAARLIEGLDGVLIISCRERRRAEYRTLITFNVEKPTADEQRSIWLGVLGDSASALDGTVDRLVSQFSMGRREIFNASMEAPGDCAPDGLGSALWDACRARTRPRMGDLSQRIEPAATWDDIVLPEAQRSTLREIAVHVRQRPKVYDEWGFAARNSRGLGISALFAGASGTGKTMAAEVLANELGLDLYRIDLSQVVSKYIGETEKNLRRVFDSAEEGGAILLFDEADALFGRRSEVKDSHDRYANIEISYLLQRMEAYRGLAILTTNMKSSLDPAFLRRIRFIVEFPYPDARQREEIWRRAFPEETPTEGLNMEKLAGLNVVGGNIHNIALGAAFLAAEADEPVRMEHVLKAARREYAKIEKPLTDTEIRGWV